MTVTERKKEKFVWELGELKVSLPLKPKNKKRRIGVKK